MCNLNFLLQEYMKKVQNSCMFQIVFGVFINLKGANLPRFPTLTNQGYNKTWNTFLKSKDLGNLRTLIYFVQTQVKRPLPASIVARESDINTG